HQQAVPDRVVKDAEHCIECGLCYDACGPQAILHEDTEKETVIEASAIIIATGYEVFDARKKSPLGYLKFPDVVTSLELERMINASGPTGGKIGRLSDGKEPESVVFIQCVGSRDTSLCRPWCSCVCCMQAIKNAMLIKEKYPAIAVTIFYMDVRAYGKGYEEYYERAKNVGVRFMRGIPSDVQADKNGTGMQFRVENTETGEVETLRPGLVVLSVGIQPTDATAALAGKLGLPIEETGFIRSVHDALDTTGTIRPGIFVAGAAVSPRDIPDSVASGGAAAMRAFAGSKNKKGAKGAIPVKDTLTLWWDESLCGIRYIDQTLLPTEYAIAGCTSVDRLIAAIQRLEIRGAPVLGVAGGFGVALAAFTCTGRSFGEFSRAVQHEAGRIRESRPTAVNLSWGVDRVLARFLVETDVTSAKTTALDEARAIADEDTRCCHAIGENGATLLPDRCTVLTHCNAGALACSSWGTALGVIRSAVEEGKKVSVIACETRPLLQGARLTAWELARDGIDVTVITDSTAAHLMRTGKIDAVIVGADRITRDAVFNKIGTYMHAVCARHHSIPFYVAAPLSTFDATRTEHEVTIEERGRDELAIVGNRILIPDGVPVVNYAFDATPMKLVSAIITEQGVVRPPFDINTLLSRPEPKNKP
ncbi:MAG: S-methyl-5-thioribose-1-phosphate isomerase, partial [Methanoregula sp.]